jgi:hypothetical protein
MYVETGKCMSWKEWDEECHFINVIINVEFFTIYFVCEIKTETTKQN